MRTPFSIKSVAVLALLCLLMSGCKTETQDPEVMELRGRYVLPEEPVGALTLSEAAQQLDGGREDGAREDGGADQTAEPKPVVVVGRIYAGDLEPWDSGKASFLLAELPEQGHGEGHDADNCPFCKRKAAKAPTAIVEFVDGSGRVIPQDARKLFGVKKNDVVTIRGQVIRGELNTLLVTANAIHVRGS